MTKMLRKSKFYQEKLSGKQSPAKNKTKKMMFEDIILSTEDGIQSDSLDEKDLPMKLNYSRGKTTQNQSSTLQSKPTSTYTSRISRRYPDNAQSSKFTSMRSNSEGQGSKSGQRYALRSSNQRSKTLASQSSRKDGELTEREKKWAAKKAKDAIKKKQSRNAIIAARMLTDFLRDLRGRAKKRREMGIKTPTSSDIEREHEEEMKRKAGG